MAQGFVRTLNFQESKNASLDRGILDNLGGGTVTNDILLFDGNSQGISKLLGADYTQTGGTVTVTGEGKVAFSDGTKVSIAGSGFAGASSFVYEVFNSNGIDKFQVKNAGGSTVNPSGTLRRSNFVSRENLANLSVKRLVTSPSSQDGAGGVGSSGGDVFNSFSANAQTQYIEEQAALFYYKRSRTPRNYELSTFSTAVKFSGTITIISSTATSTTEPSDTSPGLFIVDASAPSVDPVRAFSDSSNPWTQVATSTANGALHTDENAAQANTLFFDPVSGNTPNFECVTESGSSANLIVTLASGSEIAVSTATHKLPIVVNGETYFLLLAP